MSGGVGGCSHFAEVFVVVVGQGGVGVVVVVVACSSVLLIDASPGTAYCTVCRDVVRQLMCNSCRLGTKLVLLLMEKLFCFWWFCYFIVIWSV